MRAALRVSVFPGLAQKTGPQWLSPPPAGGSTAEDQTPCSSRDRHTYRANRGFAPPTTVAQGGHVGASPSNPQPHSQLGQSSVPLGPAQLRISVLSAGQTLPATPRDLSPMGWRRLSAHTLRLPSTTSLMAGAEEKEQEKAGGRGRIDITALLRARSWGTLRLLWRAPWRSSMPLFPGKEDRART